MVALTWSVWGDDIVERELLRFEARNVDIAPVAEAVMEDIRDAEEKQFATEGQYGSGGWAPLADSTIEAKAAAGYPTEILHRTLRLLRSLTDTSSPDNIAIPEPDGFTFGSEVEYGAFHQTGTVNMPQRRPIQFTEIDKVIWMKRIQRYILTGDIVAADAL